MKLFERLPTCGIWVYLVPLWLCIRIFHLQRQEIIQATSLTKIHDCEVQTTWCIQQGYNSAEAVMFMTNLGQIARWFIVLNSWNLLSIGKVTNIVRNRTWHIMQESFSREDLDGWSDMVDVPGTYRLVFNLSTMRLFVRPVLTSPICSSNAKSSCS